MKKILLALLVTGIIFSPYPVMAATKTAILAGGCFWCVQHDFEALDGVTEAVSGYTGGTTLNPTYKTYHEAGQVPHSEAVELKYDSDKLSYEDILEYYFRHIDPTDGGGQFCDRGASYRPVIYVQNDDERATANAVKQQTKQILKTDINVDILDAKKFWPAEKYHQDYAQKNPKRYKLYRWNCGRDQRVKELWADK